MSEDKFRAGQILALEYVAEWIAHYCSNPHAVHPYLAAMRDVDTTVQAAIERLQSGESIHSVSEFGLDTLPTPPT